jgi:AraC-like DNA-binding protein
MKATRFMRSAVLGGYPELAREAGLDPARLLSAVGLPGTVPADPELRIPVAAFVRLLARSAEAAGLETFGLRLAQRYSLGTLGALALLAREQPTLGHLFRCLARYIHLHNEAMLVRIAESGPAASCSLELRLDEQAPVRQAIEFSIGGGLRVVRLLTGVTWRPTLVCFRHPAPRRLEAYVRLLEAPVRFGAGFNGITFPARDLARRIPAAEPELVRHAQRYVEFLDRPERHTDLKLKVMRAIDDLLPGGVCSAERVARHMGVDRRTLHRHLARAGSSFVTVMHDWRKRSAERYLRHGERTLAEVAEMTGFASLSAFSRWFKTSYGCNPSSWRAGLQKPGIAAN